jgi:hypothetical protein
VQYWAPLQTRFTAGGARGHRRVGRERTHIHTDRHSNIVGAEWRSGEEGMVGATTKRQKEENVWERRSNGDSAGVKRGRRIIKGWKRVSMMGRLVVVAMVEEKRYGGGKRESRHYYYQ